MNLVQALPYFLLVLGAMIFVHELGHFLVAKWLGIRVEVFSLGFGKRLIGFKRGDTDYRISLLPLGGYVKMAGDNIAEDREGAPDEFLSHSKWHRFLVAVAGPVMNIVMALAIPFVASMLYFAVPAYHTQPAVIGVVRPDTSAGKADLKPGDKVVRFNATAVPTWRDLEDQILLNPGQSVTLAVVRGGQEVAVPVTLGSRTEGSETIGTLGALPDVPDGAIGVNAVTPGGPAEKAGLKAGDEIVAVNGAPLGIDQSQLIQTVNGSLNVPVTLSVRRNGATQDIVATPVSMDGAARLGFAPFQKIPMITDPLGPVDAAAYAWDTNMRFIRLTGAAFGQIFSGQRSAGSALSGPIGIAEIVSQAAQQGVGPLFDLMGLLSLNLGIFNLLPIPVLDGGLIFMLGLEAVLGWFGRTLSLGMKEKMINVGLVLIVLLMGFVIFNDIRKHILPGGDEPKPAQTAPAK